MEQIGTEYEARYYIKNKEFSACMGRKGGSTTFTVQQILSGRAKTLIEELADHFDDFFSFNPHMKPEEDAKITVHYIPDVIDRMLIIFWFSTEKPTVSLVYEGIKNPYSDHSITAHVWELSLGSPFTNPEENSDKFINAYLDQDKSFPANHFLTLHMYQKEIYYPPYLYGKFREIKDLKPYYIESLNECPSNCYPVEIAYLTRGFFVWIKKAAYDSGSVTLNDITFYN